ncbi:MAG: nucleotide sugar dehydrogenase, partial [Deltaproteobacteria bacterium]|nr:nucleotide sugar dehydrogenase [Deltaproteobacteria bacterium]
MAANSVAIVGLGYVGLPLAIAFGKKIKTIGFDTSEDKIISYRKAIDPTAEVDREDFEQAVHVSFTNDPAAIKETDMVVVAVPTPITANKQPDLRHLVSASEIVGKNMKHGAIVVYEST